MELGLVASDNAENIMRALVPELDRFLGIFATMEIAEDEIERAKARHPAEAEAIDDTFRYLAPSHPTLSSNEALYRAHCAELCERAAKGEGMRRGTAAEAALALSEASLATPLSQDATALYLRLIADIAPELVADIEDEISYNIRGRYPGSVEALLDELRDKLAHDRDVRR